MTSSTSTFTFQWINEDRPYRVGFGPAEFSTSTALAPRVQWCADANGYYAALGVDWRASKLELRKAYQALGGPDSAYLTYVLKQLLDPGLRDIYNRRLLGHPLMDQYVLQAIRLKVRENADAARMQQIVEFEKAFFANPPTDPNEQEKLQALLDSKDSDVHDGEASPDPGYRYSHYLFRSTAGDRTLLLEWQRLVIDSCRKRGIELSVALGFHGISEKPWLVQQVGYAIVIFFHDQRIPDSLHADDAVQHIFLLLRKAQLA